MLRLSKRKAGNVREGAWEHTCKVLFIFLLWYKSLLYLGNFLRSLTNISCLSPIWFLSDLFIPNKKLKPQRLIVIVVLFAHVLQAILYRWQTSISSFWISSYLKDPPALRTTKRTQSTFLQICCCGNSLVWTVCFLIWRPWRKSIEETWLCDRKQ